MTPDRPVVARASVARVARRLFLMVVFALVSCAPGKDLPPTPEAKAEPYRLGPGDVVHISTFGEQALTGEFRVSDGGTIALPLLGSVQAQGLTVDALAQEIGAELREKKLFRDPSIAAEISTYRPVYILGEVNRPGQYAFEPGMTVLTAVTVAGGFTYRAVKDYASIVRLTGDSAAETRAQRQTLVKPGDVITIYERIF
jgi:polysaccharide export outer membrane protein